MVTISGTAAVTSRRLREYTRTSSSTLWTWMRAPSSLYSNEALPSSASAPPTSVGRIGEHRLDRLKRRQRKRREAGFAVGERGARHRREVAGEHRRAPDPSGRNARCACDGVGQHAFERALPELAEQQTEEEVLLVGGRGTHQLAQELQPGRGRSRAGNRRDAIEQQVNRGELETRRVNRWHAARAGEHGAANLHPTLTRLAAQKRDHDRDLVGRHAAQQIGQVRHLLQPARGAGDRPGNRHHRVETHPPIVPKSGCRRQA